jgi:dipeptidyl-peptidase-4
MKVSRCSSCVIISLTLLALSLLPGCGERSTEREVGAVITARMLVQPGALAGPGPENLAWSPVEAQLAYTLADGAGGEVLRLYDASSGEDRVILDPAGRPDRIDIGTAQWSPAGNTLLLAGDDSLWLLHSKSAELSQVPGVVGNVDTVMFSPDGTRLTYTKDNDLYVADLAGGRVQRLTADGGQGVFNGCLDWVYEEELATRAAQPGCAWSPDGRWLMYMRLDDGSVQNHPITDYRTVPPSISYTRYPTAGTSNPAVSLHCLDPRAGGAQRDIPLPDDAEYVLPFYSWTPDSSEAFYISVNRDHTVLRLNAFNPSSGKGRTVIEETDNAWVNENYYTAPVFLPGGSSFLWLSERDGFMHLYLYSLDGSLVRQLTQGEWLIDTNPFDILTPGRPVQVDPTGTRACFSTTAASPLERHFYRLNLESGGLERLTQRPGFHQASLSGDGQYLVDRFSSVDVPPVTTILQADGSEVRELGHCAGPSLELPQVRREFLTIKARDSSELYCQMVKPEGFDAGKKYPVVIHWYGGPGLQLVSDRYGTTNIFNHIERDVLYTQAGFIVWRLDTRGSFGRGHAFETPIQGQFGPAALQDQLAGVDYLKTLPYVDGERIGTDGKSFGGFLTLYALIHAPGVFRGGVAGSGPTDWAWYDTIYTERYMRTPAENPGGYASVELVSRAGDISAAPLIIHGLADTNVHLQNSVNFIAALEGADKPFFFIPLPGEDHHYEGDGLATALVASADYFKLLFGEP